MENTKQAISAIAGVALTAIWVMFISGIAVWVTDPSALPGNTVTVLIGLALTLAVMMALWKALERWADPFT